MILPGELVGISGHFIGAYPMPVFIAVGSSMGVAAGVTYGFFSSVLEYKKQNASIQLLLKCVLPLCLWSLD